MSNPGVLAHNVAPSIWRKHDHRAVAAALMADRIARVVSVTSNLTFMVLPARLVKGTLRLMQQCCRDSHNTLSKFVLQCTFSVGTDVA